MRRSKAPWYFRLILLGLLLAAAEGISYLAIWMLNSGSGREIRRVADIFQEQDERIDRLLDPAIPKLDQPDSLLGWRYTPGFDDDRHRISAQGLRGEREYAPEPAPGILRIAVFGDSFVYCNEVDTDDSWPRRLEEARPDTEVLNFGVGGYGTDQALLRYRHDGRRFSPHMAVMGFVPDDIRRNINVYRRFLSDREHPLFKPRFILEADGSLTLLPNPVYEPADYLRIRQNPGAVLAFGENDFWYQAAVYENPLYDWSASVRLFTYLWVHFHNKYLDSQRLVDGDLLRPESEAFGVQCALLAAFAADVTADGARPLVVLFPDRGTLANVRNGGAAVYAPLREWLAGQGVDCLDALDAFGPAADGDPADWYAPGGHYSPAGNGRVAEWLNREIGKRMDGTFHNGSGREAINQ
jgi:hypothetical protein